MYFGFVTASFTGAGSSYWIGSNIQMNIKTTCILLESMGIPKPEAHVLVYSADKPFFRQIRFLSPNGSKTTCLRCRQVVWKIVYAQRSGDRLPTGAC